MSNKAPILELQTAGWLQALRSLTNATNTRTLISGFLPSLPSGNSIVTINTGPSPVAVASALVTANMNSLPLDWAARCSVGGTNLNFFIVKQLPILPPDTYLEKADNGQLYVELVAIRVLELTYTAHDLKPFARDLGYTGPPFLWDETRRHCLKSELDAIYAHMYHLDRVDLEWILDASPPSTSFPTLKKEEEKEFGEYRTQRLVLQAYDQLAAGEAPNVSVQAT